MEILNFPRVLADILRFENLRCRLDALPHMIPLLRNFTIFGTSQLAKYPRVLYLIIKPSNTVYLHIFRNVTNTWSSYSIQDYLLDCSRGAHVFYVEVFERAVHVINLGYAWTCKCILPVYYKMTAYSRAVHAIKGKDLVQCRWFSRDLFVHGHVQILIHAQISISQKAAHFFRNLASLFCSHNFLGIFR